MRAHFAASLALWFVLSPVLRARAWPSASTTATSASGALTIRGLDGSARHAHGGPAASLGSARFRVGNGGELPVEVAVTRVVFLTGHDCDAPPSKQQAEPAFGGLLVEGGQMRESASSVQVDPHTEVDVIVGFTAVEAYYSWCDRFAFEVTFRASGESLVAVAETNLTRVEPHREPTPR